MKIEISDWDQFAVRAAQAFGLKDIELSKDNPFYFSGYLEPPYDITSPILNVSFEQATLCFDVKFFVPEFVCTSLVIWPDGEIEGTERRFGDEKCLQLLVRGLFRLSLLTPEVQEALEITITAHQKLEWTLEYEQIL